MTKEVPAIVSFNQSTIQDSVVSMVNGQTAAHHAARDVATLLVASCIRSYDALKPAKTEFFAAYLTARYGASVGDAYREHGNASVTDGADSPAIKQCHNAWSYIITLAVAQGWTKPANPKGAGRKPSTGKPKVVNGKAAKGDAKGVKPQSPLPTILADSTEAKIAKLSTLSNKDIDVVTALHDAGRPYKQAVSLFAKLPESFIADTVKILKALEKSSKYQRTAAIKVLRASDEQATEIVQLLNTARDVPVPDADDASNA